jgi:predicted permease
MSAILDVVLPVFGLVLCGFLAGRFRVLGVESTEALNKFVYWFALPSILFIGMARVPAGAVFNWPYLGALTLGAAATVAVSIAVVRHAFPGRAVEAILSVYCASFSNSGYMGIPLWLTAFGLAGAVPAALAAFFNAGLMVGGVIVALELIAGRGAGIGRALANVGRAIAQNPLLVAPIVGIAWSSWALPLPRPIAVFLELLGACAGPAALFATGLFLAGQSLRALMGGKRAVEVVWIAFAKLAIQPLFTFAAGLWLGLEPFWLASATIMCAMPVGATAFVIAQRYGTFIERASASILLSTVVSLFTLAALMAWFDPRP